MNADYLKEKECKKILNWYVLVFNIINMDKKLNNKYL